MPRLLGTEEWNDDILGAKADYYLETMSSVGELARFFAPVQRFEGRQDDEERQFYLEVIDVRLEQLTDAVELLLVSDHTKQVIPLLADPGLVLMGRPIPESRKGFGRVVVNIRQFVRLSLFATLVRSGRLQMVEEGLEFVTSQGSLVLPTKSQYQPEFIAVLPTLFSIAVAGDTDGNVLHYFSDRLAEALQRYQGLGLRNRPETELLGIYRTFFEGDPTRTDRSVFGQLDGFFALRELERRYTNRIREMRSDHYHWTRMNPPGDLIDWVLLITQVAMLRRDRLPFLPEDFAVSLETRFCWNLASTFA